MAVHEQGRTAQAVDDPFALTQPIKAVRPAAPPPERQDGEQWHVPFPRLPRILVVVAVALSMLSIGLPNIAPGIPFMAAEGSPVRMFFGVSEEMNLPTFFSVLLLVAAGVSHLLVGRLAGGPVGTAFLVTGGVLVLMGFDDFAALHERLNDVGVLMTPEGFSGARYVWVVPASIVAVVILVAFWRLVSKLRGPARIYLLAGMVVVLFAAMGLETVNGFLDRPGTDGMPLQIGTHLEELTENFGMILVLYGALSILRTSRRPGGFALRLDDVALGRTAV